MGEEVLDRGERELKPFNGGKRLLSFKKPPSFFNTKKKKEEGCAHPATAGHVPKRRALAYSVMDACTVVNIRQEIMRACTRQGMGCTSGPFLLGHCPTQKTEPAVVPCQSNTGQQVKSEPRAEWGALLCMHWNNACAQKVRHNPETKHMLTMQDKGHWNKTNALYDRHCAQE